MTRPGGRGGQLIPDGRADQKELTGRVGVEGSSTERGLGGGGGGGRSDKADGGVGTSLGGEVEDVNLRAIGHKSRSV